MVTVDFDRDSIASSNGTLALELTAERREDERLCRAPRLPPASMLCGMRALTYFVEVDSASCGIQLFDDACRAYFRNRLFESIKRHSSQLHAYALLADHAWLLVSISSHWPLASLIGQVLDAYLIYFNQRFRRSSRRLRFYSALCRVEGERVVRECYRYIEQRPLKVGESELLGDIEWSSYPSNAFGHAGSGLVRHGCLESLGSDELGSLARYRSFVAQPLDPLCERYLDVALHERSNIEERNLNPAITEAFERGQSYS